MLRDRLRGGPSSRCLFALVLVVGAALSGVGAAGVASASTAHTASASTAHTASGLPGQWENETVDSQGDVGMRASVALNGNGDPHVAYYDKTNKDLKYATRSGGSWQTGTVDAAGGTWTFTTPRSSVAPDPLSARSAARSSTVPGSGRGPFAVIRRGYP